MISYQENFLTPSEIFTPLKCNSSCPFPRTLSVFLSNGIPNSKQFLSYFQKELSEFVVDKELNCVSNITSMKIQQIFYHDILHNVLAQKYNIPSINFKINVMRNYIDMIENCENNDEGVYDNLIEEYSEMLIGNNVQGTVENNMDCSEGGYFYGYDMKESSFRIYDFLSEKPIVVRVFPQFLNVGLALWVDGLVVIEYIISNLELFERKNIVELGSGIGLVGLFLMNVLKEKGRITMTDYLDCVLENCSYCCELNNIPHQLYNSEYIYLKKESITKCDNDNLHVMKLDWMNFTTQDIELLKDTDILIAADVAYDASVIPGLCNVTQQLFNKNRNLIILFAITKRNEKTFEYFVSEMEKCEMVVSKEISTTHLPHLFIIEDRTSVRLFEMKGMNQ